MQNLTTLKTVLFAALLTVPALSASAQCPGGGACPQAVEDCACPAQMGSGEDCACPQVKTIETRQPGGCIQAASKNGVAARPNRLPIRWRRVLTNLKCLPGSSCFPNRQRKRKTATAAFSAAVPA